MTIKLRRITLCALTLISCISYKDCKEGINLLPMYGKTKKCADQLKSDREFMESCDNQFKTRSEASIYYTSRAWEYFNRDENDMAMKRFNQAWLLDSTNADIYWGFGNILGKRKKYEESLIYFETSTKLNPNNAKVWLSSAYSYGRLFYQSSDSTFLNKAIFCLKKSVSLEPENARAYAALTGYYAHFYQKDSARKYLDIAEKIDSTVVNPQLKELLK